MVVVVVARGEVLSEAKRQNLFQKLRVQVRPLRLQKRRQKKLSQLQNMQPCLLHPLLLQAKEAKAEKEVEEAGLVVVSRLRRGSTNKERGRGKWWWWKGSGV